MYLLGKNRNMRIDALSGVNKKSNAPDMSSSKPGYSVTVDLASSLNSSAETGNLISWAGNDKAIIVTMLKKDWIVPLYKP